ncbi:hypothetical protein DFJ73DRAFT_944643 [Zopfochytrium polystomum]|nr:hypothetical protein DFJ73DRAFT_944643 [Zopfochytrium polystomum]
MSKIDDDEKKAEKDDYAAAAKVDPAAAAATATARTRKRILFTAVTLLALVAAAAKGISTSPVWRLALLVPAESIVVSENVTTAADPASRLAVLLDGQILAVAVVTANGRPRLFTLSATATAQDSSSTTKSTAAPNGVASILPRVDPTVAGSSQQPLPVSLPGQPQRLCLVAAGSGTLSCVPAAPADNNQTAPVETFHLAPDLRAWAFCGGHVVAVNGTGAVAVLRATDGGIPIAATILYFPPQQGGYALNGTLRLVCDEAANPQPRLYAVSGDNTVRTVGSTATSFAAADASRLPSDADASSTAGAVLFASGSVVYPAADPAGGLVAVPAVALRPVDPNVPVPAIAWSSRKNVDVGRVVRAVLSGDYLYVQAVTGTITQVEWKSLATARVVYAPTDTEVGRCAGLAVAGARVFSVCDGDVRVWVVDTH